MRSSTTTTPRSGCTITYPVDDIFPTARTVYRNSGGQIVAGAVTTGLVDPNGVLVAEAEIESWAIFPDVASTDVYVDPGIALS